MRYLLLFLVIFHVLSCKKETKNIESIKQKGNFYDIFSIRDSIILKYPAKMYPARIYDICSNLKSYYVLGINSKYPLVKFTKNGDFIKSISQVGPGPGEFSFIPEKMDLNGDNLAILLSRLSELYIFKEDRFKQKRILFFSYDSSAIKNRKGISRPRDISWANNELLIFYSGGGSKYQVAVLDEKLRNIKTLIPLPPQNSITGLLLTEFWAVQKNKNLFITNIDYPPIIYQFNFTNTAIKNLHELNNIKLNFFKFAPSDMTYDKIIKLPDKDKLKIFKKYSKILWVVKNNDKIIGFYSTFNNKKEFYIFIIKGNKIIAEQKIPPYYIIPEGNELYLQKFSGKTNNIKLYKLKLKI